MHMKEYVYLQCIYNVDAVDANSLKCTKKYTLDIKLYQSSCTLNNSVIPNLKSLNKRIL